MARGKTKPVQGETGGGVGKTSEQSITGGGAAKRRGQTGARIHHDYHDRTEPTVGVTRDDLREIRDMGSFQQALFGVGSFLFSGAFWLLATLLVEHAGHYTEFAYGFLFCAVSMVAGGSLAYVGYRLFDLKQQRLDKYFPKDAVAGKSKN